MQKHLLKESIETVSKNYEKILHKAIERANSFTHKTGPALHKAIDIVSNELADAEELTIDEAQQLAKSLKRDLIDAAHHLTRNKDELKSWLNIDIALIEDTLLEAFLDAADKTTVELKQIEANAATSEYHTGEIIGISTLYCDNCGEELHFQKPGHIPPCPKCQHTRFHRHPAAL